MHHNLPPKLDKSLTVRISDEMYVWLTKKAHGRRGWLVRKILDKFKTENGEELG